MVDDEDVGGALVASSLKPDLLLNRCVQAMAARWRRQSAGNLCSMPAKLRVVGRPVESEVKSSG